MCPNKCKLAFAQYFQIYKLKIIGNATNILTYLEWAQETDYMATILVLWLISWPRYGSTSIVDHAVFMSE